VVRVTGALRSGKIPGMIPLLQRVTTEYCPEQDRIRIAGLTEDGQAVVIWLARRMLGFLLPVLLNHLDEQFLDASPAHKDLLQEFAQQAAFGALGLAERVTPGQDDDTILATSVDVAHMTNGVVLTFRNGPEGGYGLALVGESLRQWMHILYQAHCKADWQLELWPAWLTGASAAAPANLSSLH
jgi:hypothetical protein